MIKFRDYQKYPQRLQVAWQFRDGYDDSPDGAFFQLAEDMGISDILEELAEWETKNTDWLPQEENDEN